VTADLGGVAVQAQLAGWGNFYVIIGSSAGALIGLQFVVIALVSSRRTQTLPPAVRAFATPTIAYFSTVLVTAGLLSVPRHTRASLALVLLSIGIVGLAYVARVSIHMRAQELYSPDRADWLWFVWLPVAAYLGALSAGASMWSSSGVALDLAGASAMLLLLVGVHNAWDGAVWMVAHEPADSQS
jgi:hypothetical protein